MPLYLCLDVGGTNCRIDLMEIRSSDCHDPAAPLPESASATDEILIAQEIYPTQQFSSVTFLIQKFLSKHCPPGVWPVACCLVVAGPVRANRSHLTNVNWTMDGEQIAQELNIPKVQILNDFVGIGYGLLAITRSHMIALNDVPLSEQAPKAVIGAGTGLGEAFLTYNGKEYDVFASEGGHCDFAPRDDREFGLLQYLLRTERVTRVSVERIVSGTGIPHIYEYFCSQHPEEVKDEVQQRIRVEDPGKVISEYAQSGKCSLCVQTIQLFVRCYGAEAGNLALKTLPFGGLYIAGGIAPKLKWAMEKDHEFWHNFINKGRMRGLLERVPVFLIVHSQPGLLGAKVVARRMVREEGFRMKGELPSFPDSAPKVNPLESLIAHTQASDDLEHEIQTSQDGAGVEKVIVRKRKNSAKPAASQDISQIALIRAAFLGGLAASVCTLLLSAWMTNKRRS